jgi:hypothetical protein
MVFTLLTFFVSNGFATIWHGFVCDLTRIDRIRRIFNVFVDFCPIPPVSGPGQTPGGPWPSGPGRPLGRPRVGPGRALGGPWAPVKSMFDGGCLNGQGTNPVKNSVKNPVENSVKNSVKNSVDLLVNFVRQFRCGGSHKQKSHKNPLENSPRKSGSDFAYKSDQRDGLQLHPGGGVAAQARGPGPQPALTPPRVCPGPAWGPWAFKIEIRSRFST